MAFSPMKLDNFAGPFIGLVEDPGLLQMLMVLISGASLTQ